MKESYSESYKKSGVDVTAGYRAVELMKSHVERTKTPGVLSGLGGFGGLFAPDLSGMSRPVFVSGTDGVGTKLKLAFLLDKHDTIGIDCVAMCVNDVICAGAKPLFFLDYIACGKNIPEKIATIVSGIASACVESGCALIGGETAEMPGFYPEEEYDLAGFSVGVVDYEKILDFNNVKAGDVLLSLPSSGVHSNGFSLVRRVFNIESDLMGYEKDLGAPLGEVLLAPTCLYVKPILALLEKRNVKSLAHITGGGFYENIPRALPEGLMAVIEKKQLDIPPIFKLIQEVGNIPERDMYNTFNMGTGMCAVLAPEEAVPALELLRGAGVDARVIGEIKPGSDGVLLC